MFNRLSLSVAALAVFGTQSTGLADPITYDFSGQFNQPFNGSTQISGSFTFNPNPTLGGYSYVSETGSDVSITVNAGGQVYNFVNDPQNPFTSATVNADVVPAQYSPPGESEVEIAVLGAMESGNLLASFGMTFYSPGGLELLQNLRNFNYVLNTSSVSLQVTSQGTLEGGYGSVTSIELVSTPEPSTLALFAVFGIAAMVHRSLRRS